MPTVLCGYCRGPMPGVSSVAAHRCLCGARAITRLPTGGVFVHPEGCDGAGCDCVAKAADVWDGGLGADEWEG